MGKVVDEIWRPIKNYEGLYEISNLGKVKALNYNRENIEKELAMGTGKGGYLYVTLYKNAKAKRKYIHRLVAETFIISNNHLPCVNHIDGCKQNNIETNLEWCDYKENIAHAYKLGLYKTGEKHPRNKKVLQYDMNGNFIKEWQGVSVLCKNKNYSQGTISMCCRGERKSAYGFIWKYKD